jgi:hypothetical protein
MTSLLFAFPFRFQNDFEDLGVSIPFTAVLGSRMLAREIEAYSCEWVRIGGGGIGGGLVSTSGRALADDEALKRFRRPIAILRVYERVVKS